MDSWSSKTGHALSLIAMANLNIKKDNLTMAQINLNLVELEKVELELQRLCITVLLCCEVANNLFKEYQRRQ